MFQRGYVVPAGALGISQSVLNRAWNHYRDRTSEYRRSGGWQMTTRQQNQCLINEKQTLCSWPEGEKTSGGSSTDRQQLTMHAETGVENI